MGAAPKKYVKINGIMKLNPEYKRWKDAQGGPAKPATTVLNSAEALPIVSSMDDHMAMNEDLGQDIPLAESTNATIEMIQEPEIAAEAGLQPDDMVDELGALLAKYEIPIGLTNKLMMMSEYQSLEFIIDDSGSMTLQTDSNDPRTRRPMTRWVEAQTRLKEMIEIVAYVPFEQIGIEFLNRKDRISLSRQGRTPKDFLAASLPAIDAVFSRGPSGTTPALEKLQESFMRGQGASIARYFFGDGKPNGGQRAVDEIIALVRNRPDPDQNPVTFISCTDEDAAVEWMKDAEEIAPYCSESDDFHDEAREVLKDQGAALPYSQGFHLICQLVAAMNPDDLDAMDESVPFTKFTLDNLLGVVSNDASYQHYFDKFLEAQRARPIEIDDRTGRPSRLDEIRKNTQWNYEEFRSTNGPATLIRHVQEVKRQLQQAA
jgi:hypothetical protein